MTVRRRRVSKRRDVWDESARRFVRACPPPWEPIHADDLADLETLVGLHGDQFREGAPMYEALIRTGRATDAEVAAFIDRERASIARLLAGKVDSDDMTRFRILDAPPGWVRQLGRSRKKGLDAWVKEQER